MTWTTEFTGTTPGPRPKRVEYQTNHLAHHSPAERPDRVKVSGRVVHRGWASDQRGYYLYASLLAEWYATEDRGIHNPMCRSRALHTNPAHVCDPDIPNPFKPEHGGHPPTWPGYIDNPPKDDDHG